MFKIPNWEDDVPKNKMDFGHVTKIKKKKENTSPQKSDNINKIEKNKSKKLMNKKQPINLSNSKQNGFTNSGKRDNKTFKKVRTISTNGRTEKDKPAQHIMSKVSDSNSNKKKKRPKKRKIDESAKANNNYKEETQSKKSLSLDATPSKAKKKKLNNENDQDEGSILLPISKKKKVNNPKVENVSSPPVSNKLSQKKEKFRKLLQQESNRSTINVSGDNLRQRMLGRLKSAQFRFLNEKLYTTSGSEAQKLFQADPDAFHTYHQGYQQQLKKWPVNPLDVIIKRISKMPKTHLIADMGCGEAALSRRVSQPVRSFDLVAAAPGVEACDMAHTPLLAAAVDAVVYCLALMGTDLTQYLLEANRVLKMGGHLLIAEVESRFENVDKFAEEVQRLGFKLKNLDKSHSVFFFMEFVKIRDPPAKKGKLPALTLKPCLYKKR